MIRAVTNYLRDLAVWLVEGWNRFWFTPSDPATLSLIRMLAGGMLLYTHLVWSIGLEDFFLPDGWISAEAASISQLHPCTWSYFWWIQDSTTLWVVHIAALVAFAMLTIGLFSRVSAVVSFLAAVSYVNRVPGAQFGLDQINVMLVTYLMLGPCGARYSVDRWLADRERAEAPPVPPMVSANLAIRLIQLHMCVIYFFAGLSKLQGDHWWRGDAFWGAVANLEYQSWDLIWLANWPVLVALLTSITVYWELSFCVLVWVPKLRPLILALAVPLHMGIALGMGMITFGLVMLFGCLSFVSPSLVRKLIERDKSEQGRGGATKTAAPQPPARGQQQRRRPPAARASKLA
ncbi:MAG TPA: HTTM domain-containing protein [Pirellulales bacterium]|nr:HTTM domain-containing protein [Pirellulales bacterium]